jgi:hypothetical protein
MKVSVCFFTRSVILRGENGIRVFDSSVLRRISGPMKQTDGENYVMGTSQYVLLPLLNIWSIK